MPTPGGAQCGVLKKLSDKEFEGECCFAACRTVTLFWSGRIRPSFPGGKQWRPRQMIRHVVAHPFGADNAGALSVLRCFAACRTVTLFLVGGDFALLFWRK